MLITTGGTGGHVIPAKIIADHLKNDFDIFFSIDIRGYKFFRNKKDKYFIINTPKLNFDFMLPYKILKIFYLTIKSIIYLRKFKIDKIVSTGGYMSLPLCIGGKFLGLKIYLFEPNLTLGRSNRFFLSMCRGIMCYSNEIKNFPSKFKNKIKLIEPLVPKIFYEIEKKDQINKEFCFLVIGGSQGAKFFDELVKQSILDLNKNYQIKVIQQTTLDNIESLENFYNKNNVNNLIFNFEENLINLINQSDLCITRAGASSLAEISMMNIPFITIPLPSAKDNHQMENAKFYEKKGCCWVLDQKTLEKKKFTNILSNILDDKSEYINMKKNLKKLNFQNSWNDVNQKLRGIINEN